MPVMVAGGSVSPKNNTSQTTGSMGVLRPITADNGSVSRPTTTTGKISRPTTTVSIPRKPVQQYDVVKPITEGAVTHSVTTVSVIHPTTQLSASTPQTGGNTAVASSTASKTGSSAATASDRGKAPGTGSFSSFAAKDLKAASVTPNVGGLSQTKEDVPQNALLDAARNNKADLSGNVNAIAPRTGISESELTKKVTQIVEGGGKKK